MKKQNATSLRMPNRRIRWVFAFSLIALLLFISVLYQQKRQQEDSRGWVNHTNFVIHSIDTIQLLLSETSSGVRGYLLTRDEAWQTTLRGLIASTENAIGLLKKSTDDNATQQTHVQNLSALYKRKKQFWDTLLSGSSVSKNSLQKMHPSGEAIQLSHTITQLLASMRSVENGLLSDRISQNEKSFRKNIYTAVFGGIFAFVLVITILFQLNNDMSRRKMAEEATALNEEKYRKLIENAGAVMYTADDKGIISFANQRVAELTGYTVEELSGKHFSFLIDAEWREKVVSFYIEQYVARKNTTLLEFVIHTKDGQRKWVEQSSQLLYESDKIIGFQCMVRDINERKLMEEELSLSESVRKQNDYRFNSILNNTSTLIFIKDLSGHYIMVNRRFKEVLGLTDEMVLNKTDFDFSPEEQARHYQQIDEQVLTTLEPIQIEETVRTASGVRNLLLVKFPLLDDKKQAFGISGIATDITEIIQARRQMEDALGSAQEARELQEQFLANMSHEIRTPLNGIQGMTTLLLETELNNEQKEFTTTISRSLNNLIAIVNNILDFSNIKTGKLTLQKAPFSIREVVDSVKKQFEYQLKKKTLLLEVTIKEDVPAFVTGDAARLKQVLVNLVDNAVKFTDSGQVSIEVFLLENNAQGTKISFSVIDTGIGIPSDKFETIFKSFAQANIDISHGYGGAGLGLAISKGLIELQGGNISVRSQVGNGSVFRFIISYSGEAKEKNTAPAKNDDTIHLKDKRFLVVEDNPVNQRLVSFVLQKVGGKVDLAFNGKEAIDMLQADPGYDLILMDVQMPVMGGYEATTYIRKTLQLQMPIIALTATALKEDQDKCREVGMNDFILKPFDFKDLYQRLTSLLLNRPQVAQSPVAAKIAPIGKMYDLSLLEELEDKKYVYDMIGFFLQNAPADINQLVPLTEKQDWDALYKTAHKAKGAAGMLQVTALIKLLAKIESDARDKTSLDAIHTMAEEAVYLFSELVKQLEQELVFIEKDLPAKD
jgi:PAS domain S-box-containing protein